MKIDRNQMMDERNMVESMKRNRTLDITKGIGIIFMVLGHMHFSDDVFNYYVYAFHMPLFFIVSGMLFKENKSIKETVKSRAKSLLIPYLVFGGGVRHTLYCDETQISRHRFNHFSIKDNVSISN